MNPKKKSTEMVFKKSREPKHTDQSAQKKRPMQCPWCDSNVFGSFYDLARHKLKCKHKPKAKGK